MTEFDNMTLVGDDDGNRRHWTFVGWGGDAHQTIRNDPARDTLVEKRWRVDSAHADNSGGRHDERDAKCP